VILSLLGAAVALAAAAQTASYSELLHRYAAGDRAAAVAELSSLEDGLIARELDALRDRANAHCASCDPSALQADLRAAVMLHTDLDELDRRPLQISGERAPSCAPPVHALFAERALAPLLSNVAGREFARRWYVAMGLRSLGDLCLEEGRRWVGSGLKRFGKDKELLLTHGVLSEAMATVARLRQASPGSVTPRELEQLRQQQLEGHGALTEAGKAFEQALATDPTFEEASLHLGRVRYWLGQTGPALQALGPIFAGSRDQERLYLAYLFVGRVHEAAGRTAEAERAYKNAAGVDPDGQAAAMALAHLGLMAGDSGAAREILDQELGRTVPRSHEDPFWNYQFGPARRAEPLFEALRNEATTP
jgi:tetratricopeptide (TPR) repeat protein